MHPSAPRRLLSALAALCALLAPASAQRQFAEDVRSALPPLRDPGFAIAAADVDGDGHVDLFLGNQAVFSGWQNRLYLGDGGGSFTDVTATHLPAGRLRTSGVAAADVDGDGDPDLVTANEYGDPNQLYLNDGTGVFAAATFGRLPPDSALCRDVIAADLDGDGDVDLAFASYRQELLYLNDGQGFFTDATAARMAPNATSTWDMTAADLDADGDTDLVLADQDGPKLLLNDGNAGFTDVTAARMPPVSAQCLAVAVGDVDGDGDPDLVSGYWRAPATVHLNDGAGAFTAAPPGSLTVSAQSIEGLALGDVDGDGDLDLWASVWLDRWTPGALLFDNDGSGAFTDVTASQVLSRASDSWRELLLVDVDGDGDLDLSAPGYWTHERLLLNDGAGTFGDAMPRRLSALMDVPRDLALADLDGDGDADLVSANGFDDWQFWPNRLHLNDGHGSFTDATAGRLPDDGDDSRAVVATDLDGDGALDLVFGNHLGQNTAYLNDGAGTFTDATATLVPAAAGATTSLAAADVDGDGDQDLVVGNMLGQTELLLNDGSGRLTDATATNMPAAAHETRAVALGDVNGDGAPDVVVATGLTRAAQNRLYLNDGAGAFTDVTATHLPSRLRHSACLDLGDADGDGDLDLVIGNDVPGGFGRTNELYLNDGSGVFAAAWLVYDLDNTASIAFVDADDDGDLDVVCADPGTYNKLYLNDGSASFTDATQRMPGLLENTVTLAVGDVDGDGDADLVAGDFGQQQVESVVHLNHCRQLGTTDVAAIGEVFVVDAYSRAGYATAPQTATVLLGLAPAAVALPPMGVLGLDPTSMVALPPLPLAPPGGKGSLALPIPPAGALAGVTFYVQALVMPTANASDARLTNVLRERIHAF